MPRIPMAEPNVQLTPETKRRIMEEIEINVCNLLQNLINVQLYCMLLNLHSYILKFFKFTFTFAEG